MEDGETNEDVAAAVDADDDDSADKVEPLAAGNAKLQTRNSTKITTRVRYFTFEFLSHLYTIHTFKSFKQI